MTADNTQSNILVTLPKVTHLSLSGESERGDLSLECITLQHDTPKTELTIPNDRSVYLIFHFNEYVYPIDPAIPITLKYLPTGERTYSFRPTEGTGGANSEVHLTIPPPGSDTHLIDANEIFDHVLAQYAELSRSSDGHPPIPSYDQAISTAYAGMNLDNPELRGRLVLWDEANGQVVGEPPQTLKISEDETLRASRSQEKSAKGEDGGAAPVVLELPPDVYDAYLSGRSVLSGEGEELRETREVFVTVIPPEERDWVTRSAGLISSAISASTTLAISGISAASDYYIAHSKPYTPPDSSSSSNSGTNTPKDEKPANATPHPALTGAHALSEKATWASSKTAELVEGLIQRAVGGSEPSTSADKSEKDKPVGTLDKLMLSAGLVLATVDDSAKRLLEMGSEKLGAVVGHKYGPQAQQSTLLAAHTTKNVVLVYVDMQGFARKALIKKAGKAYVKGKFKGKEKSS